MTYQETVNWMFSRLPMYQREGKTALKKDLTNILKFSEHLKHPDKKFKSIHVGGTNGKGSTSHMLASVLQEAGYKVGLYTSPHLKNFTERIRINGNEIPQDCVIRFIQDNRVFLEHNNLSFFEMTVGMAFDIFAKENVDIAIIEVGLGGRLDSTNIIYPELSIITNIGLDHTQFLGETLSEIAFEKAGIIKPNRPVIIGEKHIETTAVFEKRAAEMNADIVFASDSNVTYKTDLLGNYQINNVKTAVNALNQLKGFKISKEDIENGLQKVIINTNLKGRWQVVNQAPRIVYDTAHNVEGLTYVLKQLSEQNFDKLHIVLGVVSDKDLQRILPLFPQKATYYFCKPNIPRGLSAKILQKEAKRYKLMGESFGSVNQSLEVARKNAALNDLIFVGGSTFVVAEIL